MKSCSKCKIQKNKSEFSKQADTKDGLRTQCKKCIREYTIKTKSKRAEKYILNRVDILREEKQRRLDNLEKYKLKDKVYWQKNKDKIKKNRGLKNKDIVKEYNRNYYVKNRNHIRESNSKYYVDNKDKIKAYKIDYWSKNKDRLKKAHKSYYDKNIEKIKKNRSVYYSKNKDKIKEYTEKSRLKHIDNFKARIKRYYLKNKKDINKKNCQYSRIRKKVDVQYKLSFILRDRVSKAIKNNYKAGSAVSDLGCSVDFLKEHLESQFYCNKETGEIMSWDNYGLHGWHVDHIKPLKAFDLANRGDFLEACNYKNLQPLWAKDNLSKGSRLDWNKEQSLLHKDTNG